MKLAGAVFFTAIVLAGLAIVALYHMTLSRPYADALLDLGWAVREYKDKNGRWPDSLDVIPNEDLKSYNGITFEYDPTNRVIRLPGYHRDENVFSRTLGWRTASGSWDPAFVLSDPEELDAE